MRKHRKLQGARPSHLGHGPSSSRDKCESTGTLATLIAGLAVRRGRNGLASCQSACHSSDEPGAGSTDLHTDHSVMREPHIQKTLCGHMAASAVVCGRPERPLGIQKAVPCHSCMHHTPHGVYTSSRVNAVSYTHLTLPTKRIV